MQLIIITTDTFFLHEAIAINTLFKEGLQTLHVRKPQSTKSELEELINQIDSTYYDKIVLHEHFELVRKYNLKGYHLNRRNPALPKIIDRKSSTVSRSCHSFNELQEFAVYDYLFLSPIFDSVSKKGYRQAYLKEDLLYAKEKQWINNNVYALGGITPYTLPLISNYSFGGAVVLGYLWNNYKEDKDLQSLLFRYKNLLSIIQTL